MEGMGEEKLYLLFLKSVKCQKAPEGRSVSTHFITDCSYYTLGYKATCISYPDQGWWARGALPYVMASAKGYGFFFFTHGGITLGCS